MLHDSNIVFAALAGHVGAKQPVGTATSIYEQAEDRSLH